MRGRKVRWCGERTEEQISRDEVPGLNALTVGARAPRTLHRSAIRHHRRPSMSARAFSIRPSSRIELFALSEASCRQSGLRVELLRVLAGFTFPPFQIDWRTRWPNQNEIENPRTKTSVERRRRKRTGSFPRNWRCRFLRATRHLQPSLEAALQDPRSRLPMEVGKEAKTGASLLAQP